MAEPNTENGSDNVLMSWQSDAVAYDCVQRITQTSGQPNRSTPLQKYGVNSEQQCLAIASMIVGDSETGVNRFGFKMSINAIKDVNAGWTLGQLSNRIQSNAEPNLG